MRGLKNLKGKGQKRQKWASEVLICQSINKYHYKRGYPHHPKYWEKKEFYLLSNTLKFNGRMEVILIFIYIKPLVNNPSQIIDGLGLPGIAKERQAVSLKNNIYLRGKVQYGFEQIQRRLS